MDLCSQPIHLLFNSSWMTTSSQKQAPLDTWDFDDDDNFGWVFQPVWHQAESGMHSLMFVYAQVDGIYMAKCMFHTSLSLSFNFTMLLLFLLHDFYLFI